MRNTVSYTIYIDMARLQTVSNSPADRWNFFTFPRQGFYPLHLIYTPVETFLLSMFGCPTTKLSQMREISVGQKVHLGAGISATRRCSAAGERVTRRCRWCPRWERRGTGSGSAQAPGPPRSRTRVTSVKQATTLHLQDQTRLLTNPEAQSETMKRKWEYLLQRKPPPPQIAISIQCIQIWKLDVSILAKPLQSLHSTLCLADGHKPMNNQGVMHKALRDHYSQCYESCRMR